MNEVKVKPRKNMRNIQDESTDLDLRPDRETVLIERHLKSNEVKKMLFNGLILVTDGELEFNYKGANCKISSKKPNELLFSENGIDFIKDLDTTEVYPKKLVKEEKLKEEKEVEVEEYF